MADAKRMSNEVLALIARRLIELNQEIYTIHQDLEKWREPKYTDHERTKLSLRIKQCGEEAHKWLRAIEDDCDE